MRRHNPTVATSSEPWPTWLLTLWQAATAPEQRHALRYRMALRCAVNPDNVPRPDSALCDGLRDLERLYRSQSWCRGGRQSWE